MGIDTIGIVRGRIDPLKLFGLFEKQVQIISTIRVGCDDPTDFVRFEFQDGEDFRSMCIFRGDYGRDYEDELADAGFDIGRGKEYTLFSLGCYGNSVALIEKFVKFYGGGWMIDNDCESEWREVVA